MEFSNCEYDKTFALGSRYHLITHYEWDALDVISRYFWVGINNNEKCLYFTDMVDLERLFYEFDSLGINIASHIAGGQFQIKSSSKFYIEKGTYNKVDNFLILINEALEEGYEGLRIIGDRDCFVDKSINETAFVKFEEDIEKMFINYPIATMSCYNIDKFGVNNMFELIGRNPNFIFKCDDTVYIHSKGEEFDKGYTMKMAVDMIKNLLVIREDLKKQNTVYKFLGNLAAEVAYKDSHEEILTIILRRFVSACMADMGIIWMSNNPKLKINNEIFIQQNVPEEYLDILTKDRGDIYSLITDVNIKGKYYCIDERDEMSQYIRTVRDRFNIKSSITIPIWHDKKISGILYLVSVKRNSTFKGQSRFLVDSCKKAASILSNQAGFISMYNQLLQMQKMDALGVLTSGIAHEFNNLLTPILGFAQILKSRIDDPDLKTYLAMIENSARDGAMIVKRVREFTRREDRESRIKLDINDVITNTIYMTQPKWKNEAEAMEKSISITKKLDSTGFVMANPTEMREVVTNILINAVDAVKKEGEITISSWDEYDSLCFSIEDNGAGMSEEVVQNVFTPFFTTKNERGTGLGLPITYNIIRDHGGTIDVWSKIGTGTRITVKLPVCSYEIFGDSSIEWYGRLTGRVLVVDDQDAVRETASRMLEEMGLKADAASNGKDAVHVYQKEKHDIVLCDLSMPDMTGIEVAKKIKTQYKGTCFILMTGWAGWISDSDRECIDIVIDKPFTMQTLYNGIKNGIERRYSL